MKLIPLKPVKISPKDFDPIEKKIKEVFKKDIYLPIMKQLGISRNKLENSSYTLLSAIMEGKINFSNGTFSGKFNATISRELKELGAKWNRKDSVFKIAKADLPMDVRNAISASIVNFEKNLQKIDQTLAKITPEEIAGQIKISSHFDKALWKVEKDFQSSVKNITIAPTITDEMRKKIADEWQLNMDKWINEFLPEHIYQLREDVKKNVFAGNRYENLTKTIQKSYGVSANKAKFLARQETNLLMTKYKESRYQDAGVDEYKWGAVSGTAAHPVRPRHKALADASKAGKLFRWDDPPVTSEPGQPERRNNPGEDYNCRCFAIPVVKFKKGK